MHAYRRVLGAVDGRRELPGALGPLGMRFGPAAVDASVGMHVGVHDAQRVGQLTQLGRQRLVGVDRVGPDRVTADLGDHHAAQERERDRLIEEGHVGVPVGGGRTLGGVDLLQKRLVGW